MRKDNSHHTHLTELAIFLTGGDHDGSAVAGTVRSDGLFDSVLRPDSYAYAWIGAAVIRTDHFDDSVNWSAVPLLIGGTWRLNIAWHEYTDFGIIVSNIGTHRVPTSNTEVIDELGASSRTDHYHPANGDNSNVEIGGDEMIASSVSHIIDGEGIFCYTTFPPSWTERVGAVVLGTDHAGTTADGEQLNIGSAIYSDVSWDTVPGSGVFRSECWDNWLSFSADNLGAPVTDHHLGRTHTYCPGEGGSFDTTHFLSEYGPAVGVFAQDAWHDDIGTVSNGAHTERHVLSSSQ